MKFIQLPLVVLFLCVSSILHAQIDLTWGPERKANKSSLELGFVGRIKDHFYTLRKEDKVMYLAKTRIRDMSQVFEKPIQWNDFKRNNTSNKNLTFHSFRLFKDNFVFYFEDYNSKEDLQRLYAQKINFDGQPEGALLEVGSRIKQRGSKDGSFSLSFSPDSIHFLLMTNPYYDKYSSEKFQFKVVDQQLTVLHNLEVTLPFRDQDFSVERVTLSRSKIINVLAKISIPKKDRNDKEATYYYEILSINPVENGKIKEFEIKLDKKYVDEVDIIVDNKDNVKCFGFYAEMQTNGKRKDGINGIFYFSADKNSVSNINLKEFDTKLVADIAGKKRANKDKGLESHFVLKNFFDKPEGGAMILAEEQFVIVTTSTTSTGTGGTTRSTTYHYHNNSILAVNIDASGKILWYAHIPKEQNTANDNRFGSFHGMYVNGKTYIIYNDEERNAISKTYENTMSNYLKAVPVVVTLDGSGKSDKRILGDKAGKRDFTLKPNVSDKISDHEAFFYADKLSKACCVVGGRKPKTQRFGLLTIK